MQFIPQGPVIPESLLQAHEEGRVVFFCGAGISFPADLPGFEGLVNGIYQHLGTDPTPIEQNALNRKQFDATLGLLERRVPGQRIALRTALANVLQPSLALEGATDTHNALLQLARCRKSGDLRLVTTNFDRIFKDVAKQAIESYEAPMLPVVKNNRWNGVVYLHGLLPESVDNTAALNRLVVTSGDFGLAYLTERWAARFVSELFRNYAVCFVGYSIDDPVLRYMMDALAADRMLGEVIPQAYALGDCEPGKQYDKAIEWEAKGVTPILYEVLKEPSGKDNHSALHNTLKVWAETYRDGILGKERIVVDYALARPSASTRQDDFVGRMLWALSDESGLPAKRFADFNPVPSLEWLKAFSEKRYKHSDLIRFGVPAHADLDDELRFSLIRRPTPYKIAPWMALVSGRGNSTQLDNVILHLARWLMRHLNDPELIIWIAEQGEQLHDQLARFIEHELDRFTCLENEGKTIELDEIRAQAPNAVPEPFMRTLWRLLLARRVKSSGIKQGNIFFWHNRLKHDGLTTLLRLELREFLTPKIALKKAFPWRAADEGTKKQTLIDCEIVLADKDICSSISSLDDKHWQDALPELLNDFQQLLHDALNLQRELGEAINIDELPSISPHWQNRHHRGWRMLIVLLRDAWLAVQKRDPAQATRIAQNWFDLPYSTFKRLALFAASQDNCIAPDQWAEWVMTEDAWCLWAANTHREMMRLLVLQGRNLTPQAQEQLEAVILNGPPRKMYSDDLEVGRWEEIVEQSIWLRLAKLCSSGIALGTAAKKRLKDLSTAYPKLDAHDREEFLYWVSGTGDPDFEENRQMRKIMAPRKKGELVQWLKQPPKTSYPRYEDDWGDVCRTRFFHSLYALCELAKEGLWPEERWREALQVWSESDLALRSWRFAAPLIQEMPDDFLQKLAHSITWWLEVVSKATDKHEVILLNLCRRMLTLPFDPGSCSIVRNGEPINKPVTKAINHPVGRITQTLLNRWFKHAPKDNEQLEDSYKSFFTLLCNIQEGRFWHGRILLAAHLIALFRVDRAWTNTYLLPLFDWTKFPQEAKAVWEGFLWSPRLYKPLFITLKPQFLNTAHHYSELCEHSRQFPVLLTYAALEFIDDGYTSSELQSAISVLPQEGMQEVANTLLHALESAGEQREDYWKNRVMPFWHNIWPKSREDISESIAESLASLCIAARGEFSSAFTIIKYCLRPLEDPGHILHRLHESGLATCFPSEALRFLSVVIDHQSWLTDDFEHCLNAIVNADPTIKQNHLYRQLCDYYRRYGG